MRVGRDQLDEGTDPVDAGIHDAAGPDDAGPVYDGHPSHDAGNPEMGPGGGCCDAGRDRPPVLVAALLGWFLRRRRGTVAASG